MWAWISGLVVSQDDQAVVILAGATKAGELGSGIGYQIAASRRTLDHCHKGAVVSLYLETIVREDAILLYGFYETQERDYYRLLTTVQGVGAKVGLAILSALTIGEIERAIMAGDKTMLCRADGVGPKLAARLITELKDKVAAGLSLGGGATSRNSAASAGTGVGTAVLSSGQSSAGEGGKLDDQAVLKQDGLSALVNLGYGRSEAYLAIEKAWDRLANDEDGGAKLDSAKLITIALRMMVNPKP